MKIGIVAPQAIPVPPIKYGGTELVIYYLVEGLVKRGHDVTLFAVEGSKSSAIIDSHWDKQMDIGQNFSNDNVYYTLERMNYIVEQSKNFDIIHSHQGILSMVFEKYLHCPLVTTAHTDLSRSINTDPVRRNIFTKSNIVSISNNQRKGCPNANYVATVYNGTVDLDKYQLGKGGDDLAWIGRFNPYKGAHIGIAAAKSIQKKLVLAAKIEEENKDYYDQKIKPELGEYAEYIGEVDLEQKNVLLGKSKAFVMPIDWEEPFGLVVIEANACGTPVVAFARGSMSELIKDGVNGFLVEPGDTKGFAQALKKIYEMPEEKYQEFRRTSRKHMEDNFSIQRMVESYEEVYKKLIGNGNKPLNQKKSWFNFRWQ